MPEDAIADLAFISDCQTAALVSTDGSVVWWPGRRFDGPSAFSRVLDPGAGHFTIAPAAPARTTRRYLDRTLVLETEHAAHGGTLLVTDALAFATGARGHDIGLDSPGALVRVVEAVGGDVEVDVELVPRLEYGLVVPRVAREGAQVVTIGGPERLFLADGGALEVDGGSARARLALRDGERRGFLLRRAPGIEARPPAPLDAIATLEDTIAAWRSWASLHDDYDGPYRDDVLHASLVLQGLTYQPTGAVVAAPTTSLPEVPGGDANWDYRFAWLRDASLIARALLSATCSDEARRYFRWMTRAAVSCRESAHVQIVFGVAGERQLDERALEHLEGVGGSRPVRIGNAAWRQRQHDVLGEVLDVALALGDDLLEVLDDFTAAFLCQLVDRAAEQWREPDAGMWEVRDREQHHTASVAMCWVALDRGIRLGAALGPHADPGRWATARDEIRAAVLEEGWSDARDAYVGTLGGDALDAAVLLLPLVGVIDASDARMRRTVAAIETHLGDGGLLRRHEERADEGAFLPASFWLSACHALAGDVERAQEVFEVAAGCANDVGLLAEMAALPDRAAMGNVPQALSHVGLVTASRCIRDARAGRAREGAGTRA